MIYNLVDKLSEALSRLNIETVEGNNIASDRICFQKIWPLENEAITDELITRARDDMYGHYADKRRLLSNPEDIKKLFNSIGEHTPLPYEKFLFMLKDGRKLFEEQKKLSAELERLKAYVTGDEIEQQMQHFDPRAQMDLEQRFAKTQPKMDKVHGKIQEINNTLMPSERLCLMYMDAAPERNLTADRRGYRLYIEAMYDDYYNTLMQDRMIAFKYRDMRRHGYITGATGSGKTELIKTLVGTLTKTEKRTTVLIDPHGDAAKQLLSLSRYADDDFVYIDPAKFSDHTPTLNPLDTTGLDSNQKSLLAQELVCVFEELVRKDNGSGITINMQALLLPCILVLLDKPGATLSDLSRFMDTSGNEDLIELGRRHNSPVVRGFFSNPPSGYFATNYAPTKAALATKLMALRVMPEFENFINGKTTFDLEKLFNEKKTILFNLARGRIGELASEAIGRFIIAHIQAIALRRADVPESERVPVHLFIDECQNYISSSTTKILEEARKYGVSMFLAQQIAGRGMSTEMQKVVMGNTHLKIAGRTDSDRVLAEYIGKTLDDVNDLSAGEFYGRAGGQDTLRFSIIQDYVKMPHTLNDEDMAARYAFQKQRYYRPLTGFDNPQGHDDNSPRELW